MTTGSGVPKNRVVYDNGFGCIDFSVYVDGKTTEPGVSISPKKPDGKLILGLESHARIWYNIYSKGRDIYESRRKN